MSKIKTHKATVKRYRKTAGGKLKKVKAGQGHFNSRESGKTTRKKRLDITADKTLSHTINTLTPYN